jgi:phage terminase small subunit
MKPKYTGTRSATKRALPKASAKPKKRTAKRRKSKLAGKVIAERVTAVPDTHDALRSPLRDAMRERFCQALLTANTATEAAIRAGYSPASARNQASRLCTFVDIQRRLAGLFENTAHRCILRRRDVLKNASARASAAITDISDLIGLPWEEFAEKIKHHPSARAIKSVDQGREYDRVAMVWSPPYVKHIELFDPRGSERLLSDLLGWEAPKKLELMDKGYKGRIILPALIPAPVGTLPAGFWEKGDAGGNTKPVEAPTRTENDAH